MSRLLSSLLLWLRVTLVLRARVTVLVTAIWSMVALLGFGIAPPIAVAIALGAVAIGVEIACRLTGPYRAPQVRVRVVIVIVVLVVNLVYVGYPVLTCLFVLVGAWLAALFAVRVTGAADQIA